MNSTQKTIQKNIAPTFPWGKYKGETIRSVIEKNPDYIDYVLKWDGLQENFKKKIMDVKNAYSYSVFYFGKYSGLSFKDAMDSEGGDIGYHKYILENSKTLNPMVKEALEKFILKHS